MFQNLLKITSKINLSLIKHPLHQNPLLEFSLCLLVPPGFRNIHLGFLPAPGTRPAHFFLPKTSPLPILLISFYHVLSTQSLHLITTVLPKLLHHFAHNDAWFENCLSPCSTLCTSSEQEKSVFYVSSASTKCKSIWCLKNTWWVGITVRPMWCHKCTATGELGL